MTEEFNIEDVAYLINLVPIRDKGGNPIIQNGEHLCECPFCGNTKGKFSYVIQRGAIRDKYHCWVCGESGNKFELWKKLNPFGYSYSDNNGKKIATDIYHHLGNTDYVPMAYKVHNTKNENVDENVPRLPEDMISKNHLMAMKKLSLEDEHRKELLRRGFTDAWIDKLGFRSMPNYAIAQEITQFLVEKQRKLIGDPWFYEDEKTGKMTMRVMPGIILPIWHKNKLVGAQVYSDAVIKAKLYPDNNEYREKAAGIAKYMHLSTSKFRKGISSGVSCSYLPGRDESIVIVTEGILKSMLAYALCDGTVSFVGVPGVQAQAGIEDILSLIKEDAVIFEAFDMDQCPDLPEAIPENKNKILEMFPDKAKEGKDYDWIIEHEKKKAAGIKAAADKLISLFKEKGHLCSPLYWDTDKKGKWQGNYKGIDDIMVAGYADTLVPFVKKKARTLKKFPNPAV